MNYHHAKKYWDHPTLGEHRTMIDMDEPACADKTCTRDHYIVMPSALWNDYGFLFDRLSVLGSRIETVQMPDDDE